MKIPQVENENIFMRGKNESFKKKEKLKVHKIQVYKWNREKRRRQQLVCVHLKIYWQQFT